MPIPALALAALKTVIASGAATLVPEVVKALAGSKAGEAAEKVVGIAQVLTGKPDPATALHAVATDPKYHLEMQKRLSDERIRFAELEVEDRKNARARDGLFITAGRWNFRADLMILGCVVAIIYIINKIAGEAVKPEVLAIFNMAVGALLKMLGDAFAFEFGSSRGSKEKDALLKK